MSIVLFGILLSEVGFWVFLGAGLAARYLLRRTRLSSAFLLLVPVLDVVLLTLLTWDMLVNGSTATFMHGLAAVYLGFTVAFGRSIIARADAWFAHRFAGGTAPVKPPRHGRVRMRHEWREWAKMVVCAVISATILGAIILLVGDPAKTQELNVWLLRIALVTGAWLIGWPVWASVEFAIKGDPVPREGLRR